MASNKHVNYESNEEAQFLLQKQLNPLYKNIDNRSHLIPSAPPTEFEYIPHARVVEPFEVFMDDGDSTQNCYRSGAYTTQIILPKQDPHLSNTIACEISQSQIDGENIVAVEKAGAKQSEKSGFNLSQSINNNLAIANQNRDFYSTTDANYTSLSVDQNKPVYDESSYKAKHGEYKIHDYKSMYEDSSTTPSSGYQISEYKSIYDP